MKWAIINGRDRYPHMLEFLATTILKGHLSKSKSSREIICSLLTCLINYTTMQDNLHNSE